MWPINPTVKFFYSFKFSFIQSLLTLGTDWTEVACHHGDSSFCGMPSLCILGGGGCLGTVPPTFPCKPLNTPILQLRTLFQTNRLPNFFLHTDAFNLWLWFLSNLTKKKIIINLGEWHITNFTRGVKLLLALLGNNVKCWVICTNRYEISHSAKVPLPPLLQHSVCSASAHIHSDS